MRFAVRMDSVLNGATLITNQKRLILQTAQPGETFNLARRAKFTVELLGLEPNSALIERERRPD